MEDDAIAILTTVLEDAAVVAVATAAAVSSTMYRGPVAGAAAATYGNT